MQDYPKLLENGDRVGITQIDRRFCFSTCKNDLKSAAGKFKSNLAPESASSCNLLLLKFRICMYVDYFQFINKVNRTFIG